MRIDKSLTRVTYRHHETCRVMPNSEPEWRFLYPHHMPMIDSFSCILFDVPQLTFKLNDKTFSCKKFLLKFQEADASSDRRSFLYVNV